ncbi:MAG: carboxypeptidase regulatory-like domain-containing protein, partial [Mariprofundaceae bacterium]
MRIQLMAMLAAAALSLSACGGGGGGTTTPATGNQQQGGANQGGANPPTVQPNTGTINVTVQRPDGTPMPGAVVVIDQNVKQASTNAQGVAALTGLAAGAHDVHVFADGYTWVSALQVNA